MKSPRSRTLPLASIVCTLLASPQIHAAATSIPLDSDAWEITAGSLTTHLDRQCLMGTALLKDFQFANGVIEVDLAVTGARSYPGINFRIHAPGEHEHIYLRPHRAGLYPDAVQYTPVNHGITAWQLYNGPGFTAQTPELPTDRWIPLRLEVKGPQARLFIDNASQPALIVNDLKHGSAAGSIGLAMPADGTAWFSNFRVRPTDELDFEPPPKPAEPLAMLRHWELSKAMDLSQIDLESTPDTQGLTDLQWQPVSADATGLVNIARYRSRTGAPADCLYARTTIESDSAQLRSLRFGYSDVLAIFLNDQLIFLGNSAYQQRDPSFLGIIGLNDSIYLPLTKGSNDLLLAVVESFGGWGFICQDGDFVKQDSRLRRKWELKRGLRYPESAVFDPERNAIYISNFHPRGMGFISKLNLAGHIDQLELTTGLNRPTGLCLHDNLLYVAERTGLAAIDPDTGDIVTRHPIPNAGFPNDVAFDELGAAYITDSARNVIHRLKDGNSDIWLEGPDLITNPNGICIVNDHLIFGNSRDGTLRQVGLHDRELKTIAVLGPGAIMDGLQSDGQGGFIFSDFNGRVLHLGADGDTTELLNTTVGNEYAADLCYIPEQNLLIIPTLYDNRVITYAIDLQH